MATASHNIDGSASIDHGAPHCRPTPGAAGRRDASPPPHTHTEKKRREKKKMRSTANEWAPLRANVRGTTVRPTETTTCGVATPTYASTTPPHGDVGGGRGDDGDVPLADSFRRGASIVRLLFFGFCFLVFRLLFCSLWLSLGWAPPFEDIFDWIVIIDFFYWTRIFQTHYSLDSYPFQ